MNGWGDSLKSGLREKLRGYIVVLEQKGMYTHELIEKSLDSNTSLILSSTLDVYRQVEEDIEKFSKSNVFSNEAAASLINSFMGEYLSLAESIRTAGYRYELFGWDIESKCLFQKEQTYMEIVMELRKLIVDYARKD